MFCTGTNILHVLCMIVIISCQMCYTSTQCESLESIFLHRTRGPCVGFCNAIANILWEKFAVYLCRNKLKTFQISIHLAQRHIVTHCATID